MATFLDPSITTSDNLSGQVVARVGDLPEIHNRASVEVNLMSHMVAGTANLPEKIHPLRNNEMLMLNVATATSVGTTETQKRAEQTSICVSRFAPTKANASHFHDASVRVGD